MSDSAFPSAAKLAALIAADYADPACPVLPDGFSLVATIYGDDPSGPPVPYGFLAKFGPAFVVVLRGTWGVMEWVADLRADLDQCPFGPGRVECGFLHIYASLRIGKTPLRSAVREAALNAPLGVIGHSLGGALATLFAADYGADLLCTFASPKVGDGPFAVAAQNRIGEVVRYVNAGDIVPEVPISIPFLAPYVHVGAATSIGPAGSNVAQRHSIATYLSLLPEDNQQQQQL